MSRWVRLVVDGTPTWIDTTRIEAVEWYSPTFSIIRLTCGAKYSAAGNPDEVMKTLGLLSLGGYRDRVEPQ